MSLLKKDLADEIAYVSFVVDYQIFFEASAARAPRADEDVGSPVPPPRSEVRR